MFFYDLGYDFGYDFFMVLGSPTFSFTFFCDLWYDFFLISGMIFL